MNEFAEKMNTIRTINRQVTAACETVLRERIMKYSLVGATEQSVKNFKVVDWNVVECVDPRESYFDVKFVSEYWDGFRTDHLAVDAVKKFLPDWNAGSELAGQK